MLICIAGGVLLTTTMLDTHRKGTRIRFLTCIHTRCWRGNVYSHTTYVMLSVLYSQVEYVTVQRVVGLQFFRIVPYVPGMSPGKY